MEPVEVCPFCGSFNFVWEEDGVTQECHCFDCGEYFNEPGELKETPGEERDTGYYVPLSKGDIKRGEQ